MKIIEYDVKDKEIYYIQEFYKDEHNELHQAIMYLASADDREINSTRARVPQVLEILCKKCYLNKDHETIKIEWLDKVD